MEQERVLITGAGGMLGNAVYPYFAARFKTILATDKDPNEHWIEFLDVRDTSSMQRVFDEWRPTIVLHLAACTDLEFCEVNPEEATQTNADATREVAKLAEQHEATLVYISTAGVFDGSKEGYYTEQDQPCPIMHYGRTKYEGEIHVAQHCSRHFIVRAGWMVGGGTAKDHKFVHHVLGQIISGAKLIHAVNDRWGTPTYTHDFALNLFRLLDSRKYGTYHMVCEGSGTRYDVAKAILEICGHDSAIDLIPVDSTHFADNFFAPRPVSEMMTNVNLRALGICLMRPWREALEDYISREFPHATAGSPQVGVERRLRGDKRKQPMAWAGPQRRKSKGRRVSDHDDQS